MPYREQGNKQPRTRALRSFAENFKVAQVTFLVVFAVKICALTVTVKREELRSAAADEIGEKVCVFFGMLLCVKKSFFACNCKL